MPLPDDFELGAQADFAALDFSIDSVADIEPDPLAKVKYTGDGEVDSLAEMSALKRGFIERANKESARRIAATDSEYWFCVCFQSREQVEAFLTATHWESPSAKYLDGQKLANRMGVSLPKAPEIAKIRPADKKWAELAMEDKCEVE